MSKENSVPKQLQFDKRVVQRNLKRGVITRDELEKHLSQLPDVGDQAEAIQARLGNDAPESEQDANDEG